jgi:hypothetical protein
MAKTKTAKPTPASANTIAEITVWPEKTKSRHACNTRWDDGAPMLRERSALAIAKARIPAPEAPSAKLPR